MREPRTESGPGRKGVEASESGSTTNAPRTVWMRAGQGAFQFQDTICDRGTRGMMVHSGEKRQCGQGPYTGRRSRFQAALSVAPQNRVLRAYDRGGRERRGTHTRPSRKLPPPSHLCHGHERPALAPWEDVHTAGEQGGCKTTVNIQNATLGGLLILYRYPRKAVHAAGEQVTVGCAKRVQLQINVRIQNAALSLAVTVGANISEVVPEREPGSGSESI